MLSHAAKVTLNLPLGKTKKPALRQKKYKKINLKKTTNKYKNNTIINNIGFIIKIMRISLSLKTPPIRKRRTRERVKERNRKRERERLQERDCKRD
jgi:hypothetical protein